MKLSEVMIIFHTWRIPDIYLAVTSTVAAGINESLNLTVNQATPVDKWEVQTEITDPSSSAAYQKFLHYTPINKESLLLQPVKTEHGLYPRKQDAKVWNLESILVLLQDQNRWWISPWLRIDPNEKNLWKFCLKKEFKAWTSTNY